MPGVVPFIPLISAGLGLAGSLFGKAQTKVPPTLPGGDTAAKGALSSIQSLGNNNVPMQLLPQYQGLVSGLQQNPYSTLAQQGSLGAAGMGIGTANQSFQNAGNLSDLTNSLVPYASQLGAAAFDPQNALYNRTLGQVTDQQAVANARNGLSGTPYGASLTDQNLSNFNIDWQNNQLSRMLQGLQGYGNLFNTIGQGYNQAGSLGANAAQLFGQSAALPYQSFYGQGQDQLTLLNSLANAGTAANAVPQQQAQDYLNYLAAVNASNQTATNASNIAFGQNQQLGQGLGSALGSINWNQLFNGGQANAGPAYGYTPIYANALG